MDKSQIQLVKSSWELLRPDAGEVAVLFYQNLFLLDPEVSKLFRGDMRKQGEALMRMIGVAVARLDEPEVLLPTLRALGQRHATYGVTEAHYGTVGRALIATLEQCLGAEFTPQVSSAWLDAYLLIAETMIAAAQESVGEPSASAAR